MAEETKNNIEDEEIEEVAENAVEAAVEEAEESESKIAETDEEDDEEESNAEKKESKVVDDILEIVESTLLTVFVIIMIFTYLLHPVTVMGPSMENTLLGKDRIFMSTVYSGPHYGDIIIINNDYAYLLDGEGKVYQKDINGSRLKECIIKRVIAEPGQTINIDAENQEVTVDGKVLNEPYIKDVMNFNPCAFDFPLTVPEGYYFVMGDNRTVSADSRNGEVGLIKKDEIYGKALLRYYHSDKLNFKLLMFNNK
ncbi:MAG: signal peptidase I [Ruminococcus sp.]|uniref:signal peptidase I n=1 Tax=Ruminococcus sp. TaxID=41978 RepID=UPI001B24BCAD|nr:signal peptidase I [Ruminococcus sp.]MBO7473957.1 signal peptidase I [Ruminococcus sp.]